MIYDKILNVLTVQISLKKKFIRISLIKQKCVIKSLVLNIQTSQKCIKNIDSLLKRH